ncbi:4-hydroxythreonine-4-phosphate dehydrogenase PdxA [Candidatus Latescibacterota bacterium]
MDKSLCALTMGDPAGIGPEVVLGTLFSKRGNDIARMVVVGFPEPFLRDAELLSHDIKINEIASPGDAVFEGNILNLIVPGTALAVPLDYGIIDRRCGQAAALCIERSSDLALSGDVDAVVTAPICKVSLNSAGYDYPGHTEFFCHLTGAEDIAMMLSLGNFRIVHVTTHVAVREVPDMIHKERIMRVTALMFGALNRLGIKHPRIAISGLNPHAGESGMFGSEEREHIIPAVEELRAEGMDITGPLPPDTVFTRAYCGEFDGVVAMFHDQGHIAVKLAGFRFSEREREVAGVNTTLGLPIIRTSVDHGTAFDIAGKGKASPVSMIEAVEMAAALARGRMAGK